MSEGLRARLERSEDLNERLTDIVCQLLFAINQLAEQGAVLWSITELHRKALEIVAEAENKKE